jgi:tetratricopeptide (TPR) repeat protein
VLHFNLARAYLVKGDTASRDQAQLQLEETLKANPQFVPAKLALAELLITHGESSRALQQADDVIKRMPRNLTANLVRTMALMNMGETDRAREELTNIVKANPRSADARYQLGLLDFSEKKYKDAEESFDALAKANDPRGFQGLVNCKAREGDFDSAIQMVEARIKQQDSPELHRLLAELQLRGKRPDQAIEEYRRIVQQQPTAINYVRLGQMQQSAGQMDAAIASYTKASQLAPNEPAPLLSIAVLYDVSGRLDEARQIYEKVLKLQPENVVALNNLAYAKADQGVDLDQALSYAERAKQKLPNNDDVSDTIALIYLRKNMVEESVRVLSDLVNKEPKRALYHLHYATALYQKGDKAGAKKELELATQTGPTDKEKLRIQELRHKLS